MRCISMRPYSRPSDHRDSADNQVETSAYYEEWLAALGKLVKEIGCLTTRELDQRTAEYATGQRTDGEE